jgi:hypothetical protein
MSVWAVLATGPSMSQAVADSVRGRCDGVIAVSNAYILAPWADALVSNDSVWWKSNPSALKFVGRKFCGAKLDGTEQILLTGPFPLGSNSGLQGIRVAGGVFHATKILLLGFDMHGTHFFGRHGTPLRNTTQVRMKVHKEQFARWKGCPVVNCTPGSELKCFPMGELSQELVSS